VARDLVDFVKSLMGQLGLLRAARRRLKRSTFGFTRFCSFFPVSRQPSCSSWVRI